MFAHSGMPGTLNASQQPAGTWRELVSMGVTFGLGLAGLAGLVLFLAH